MEPRKKWLVVDILDLDFSTYNTQQTKDDVPSVKERNLPENSQGLDFKLAISLIFND